MYVKTEVAFAAAMKNVFDNIINAGVSATITLQNADFRTRLSVGTYTLHELL